MIYNKESYQEAIKHLKTASDTIDKAYKKLVKYTIRNSTCNTYDENYQKTLEELVLLVKAHKEIVEKLIKVISTDQEAIENLETSTSENLRSVN